MKEVIKQEEYCKDKQNEKYKKTIREENKNKKKQKRTRYGFRTHDLQRVKLT